MIWNTLAQNHLLSRKPFGLRWLVWVAARDASTGAPTPVGVWTGDDHETLTVEGQSRLYYGAQGSLQIPMLKYTTGTSIVSEEIVMSVTPEAEQLVRGYNIRFAPVDIHCAFYDDNGALLDIGRRFRGFVDGAPIMTPAVGGVASMSLAIVSGARLGTMTTQGKKSDQTQRLRFGDRFRRYGDLGTVLSDPWGGK